MADTKEIINLYEIVGKGKPKYNVRKMQFPEAQGQSLVDLKRTEVFRDENTILIVLYILHIYVYRMA